MLTFMLFHKERMRNTVVLKYIYLKVRYKKWKINVFKTGKYFFYKNTEKLKRKVIENA